MNFEEKYENTFAIKKKFDIPIQVFDILKRNNNKYILYFHKLNFEIVVFYWLSILNPCVCQTTSVQYTRSVDVNYFRI